MEDTAVMREAAVVEKAAEAALWERKSQKKKLSRSASSSDSDEMYSDNFSKGGKAIPPSSNGIENYGVDIITNHMVNKMLILDHAKLPPSTMSSEGHQNAAATATTTGGTYFTEAIGESGKEEQPPSELDLRKFYHLTNSHNFQCPNCRTCITRVIIVRDILDLKPHNPPPPSPPPTEHPIAGTPQMPVAPPSHGHSPAPPSHEATSEEMVERETFLCGNCFSFHTPIGDWISSQFGFDNKKPEMDPGSSGIEQPTEIPVGDAITIAIPSGETVEPDRNLGKGRKLEVIKSIVYGGLTKSITSLDILTSSASVKIPTDFRPDTKYGMRTKIFQDDKASATASENIDIECGDEMNILEDETLILSVHDSSPSKISFDDDEKVVEEVNSDTEYGAKMSITEDETSMLSVHDSSPLKISFEDEKRVAEGNPDTEYSVEMNITEDETLILSVLNSSPSKISVEDDGKKVLENVESENSDNEYGAEMNTKEDHDGLIVSVPDSATSKMSFKDDGEEELYLEPLCRLTHSHEFYCPICRSCIRKVIIQHSSELKNLSMIPEQTPEVNGEKLLRLSHCFSFFIPIALFCTSITKWRSSATEEQIKMPLLGNEIVGSQDGFNTPNQIFDRSFLKCIVSGGLTVSITSLAIVTSSATANIPDGNIVALALTNLIAGLFVIRHNLTGLKTNKLTKGCHGTKDHKQAKYLKEMLHDGFRYLLHFTIAILSFVFFGLVPPLVYAFISFRNIEDRDLRLALTAGVSLFVTAFLSMVKSHFQKPENRLLHVKSATSYVLVGAGAFGLSYLAGFLFTKLINKLG